MHGFNLCPCVLHPALTLPLLPSLRFLLTCPWLQISTQNFHFSGISLLLIPTSSCIIIKIHGIGYVLVDEFNVWIPHGGWKHCISCLLIYQALHVFFLTAVAVGLGVARLVS